MLMVLKVRFSGPGLFNFCYSFFELLITVPSSCPYHAITLAFSSRRNVLCVSYSIYLSAFSLIRIKEYNFMAKTKALHLFHNLKKTVSYAHVNAKLLIAINKFEKPG